MPSHDIWVCAFARKSDADFVCRVLRREGHLRAILVQSRGQYDEECILMDRGLSEEQLALELIKITLGKTRAQAAAKPKFAELCAQMRSLLGV
ncbi:hypothetical protein CDD81_4922 [Ophiocordyceps australis]|uniref:Uncharacterized protein n=1 Tax=Ophiocordyceps australis TaxID=1399860 RepID=A0A2C5Y3V6_9HYPO|nr:hypothetical protein CDD81_4922 [Ophiocordyceps australis]